MRTSLMIAAAIMPLIGFGGNASAQIRPESSGKPSSSEPEANPKAEGEYRPNEPGQPEVGSTARGGSQAPFENQIHKGSDPSANGK